MRKTMSLEGNKETWKQNIKRYKYVYAMSLILIAYYGIFHYVPMYGVVIGFKDFRPARGIFGSEWVGLKHFESFFNSIYAPRVISNTLSIGILDIIWGFPAPIMFALLLNEINNTFLKRTIQTLTYLPHFISIVVICSLLKNFLNSNGLVNYIISAFGVEAQNWLSVPGKFQMIYVASSIWQGFGWGSIIYLAALTSIDPCLYDSAKIDGAGRFRQVLNITLPCLVPTIFTMLILRMGSVMSVGYEKIILLYNPLTYSKADVISSYVYRIGLVEGDYSYSTAIGLFNSVVNCTILFIANSLSRKVNDTSLW